MAQKAVRLPSPKWGEGLGICQVLKDGDLCQGVRN